MSIILHERVRAGSEGTGERIDHGLVDAIPPLHEQSSCGTVFLVGAGPGDAELMTLKGLHSLRKADVVVYDRLICPDLLDEAPPQAERVFVGKASGHHGTLQQTTHINSAAELPDGRFLASLFHQGLVIVIDRQTGEWQPVLEGLY